MKKLNDVMNKYRASKYHNLWFIEKKVLFWWVRVPDTGLGWETIGMESIEGCESKNVCLRIIDEHYKQCYDEI